MTDQLDAVLLLTQDHREVEKLLDLLDRAGDARIESMWTEQVITELVGHWVVEEQHLYPAVRRQVPDGDRLADQAIADHAAMEALLKALERMDVDDPEFRAVATRMGVVIRQDLRAEEQELFPRLRAYIDAKELHELGVRIQRGKKAAPTRPHPAAPDTPPLNKVVGPGVGLVDRVRDRLSSRAQ
jgi:hemerythrin superfamily protein